MKYGLKYKNSNLDTIRFSKYSIFSEKVVAILYKFSKLSNQLNQPFSNQLNQSIELLMRIMYAGAPK